MNVSKILHCSLQVGFCFLTACSLSPKENSTELKIIIPAIPGAKQLSELSIPGFPSIRTTNGTFYPPPSSVSGFDCLMVNVMGPGIPPRGANNPSPNSILPGLYAGTSVCAYPGIFSGPVPATATEQTINLEVPVGAGRVVQLVGAMSSATGGNFGSCPTDPFPLGGGESPYDFEPYLISQATVDLFSDKAITLTNNYNDGGNTTNFFRKHIPCNPPLNLSFGSASVCNATTLTSLSFNLGFNTISATPAGNYRIDVDNVTVTGADGTVLSPLGWSGTFFDASSDVTVITIASGAGTNLLPLKFNITYSYPPLVAGGGTGQTITFNETYYNYCM